MELGFRIGQRDGLETGLEAGQGAGLGIGLVVSLEAGHWVNRSKNAYFMTICMDVAMTHIVGWA